jgi:hypothetical protein
MGSGPAADPRLRRELQRELHGRHQGATARGGPRCLLDEFLEQSEYFASRALTAGLCNGLAVV